MYERLIRGCARGVWVTWNESTRRTLLGGKKFTRPKSFQFQTRRSLLSYRNSSCSSCSRKSLDEKVSKIQKPTRFSDLFRKAGVTSGGSTAHERPRSSFSEHLKAVKFGRSYGPILSARQRVSFQERPTNGPILSACRKVSVKTDEEMPDGKLQKPMVMCRKVSVRTAEEMPDGKLQKPMVMCRKVSVRTAEEMPDGKLQKPMVMKSARISPRVILHNNGFDSLKNYFNRNATPKPDTRIVYHKKSTTSIFDKRDQPNKEMLILNKRRTNVASRYDEDKPITPAELEANPDSPTPKKFC